MSSPTQETMEEQVNTKLTEKSDETILQDPFRMEVAWQDTDRRHT